MLEFFRTEQPCVSRMTVCLGPVGFGVPIGKEGDCIIVRIPGLDVDASQFLGQCCADPQSGQLAQKVLHRQVAVGESVDGFQSISLVVVQVPWTGQPQDGKVEADKRHPT